MSVGTIDPFVGPVPESVPLPNTPLTGVLVQIRFPQILSIEKTDYIADFQEEIQQDQNLVLQVSTEGMKQTQSPNWRFFDVDQHWRLSLTTSFVTLETRAYQNRSDFAERIGKIAAALAKTINPEIMTRIGVRYVDRVHGEHLEQLEELVRPEVVGIFNREFRTRIARTMNEVLSNTNKGNMLVRWGYLPENHTHEPDIMPPIGVPSWFLDTDVYQEYQPPEAFDAAEIENRVMSFATRAYGFFRWAVTDDFLRAYGGQI